jgi:hypothetical protein
LLVPWFRAARLANEAQTWALVDWLAFGGRKFCERDDITGRFKLTASFSRFRAAAELTGYDEGTLQNLATLGRRVPQAIRIPPDKLSVTHHVCICAVADEGDQRKLLEQAVEHGWSCSELREAVRSLFATAPGQAGSAFSAGKNLLGVRAEIQRIFSALESKRPISEWPPAQREAIRHDLTELQKLLAEFLARLNGE